MPEIFSLRSLRDRLGQEVAVSAWPPVDQARINLFADATNDQWIHVDQTRAGASSFRSTIVHGFLFCRCCRHVPRKRLLSTALAWSSITG
jgi:acyl dehydratase